MKKTFEYKLLSKKWYLKWEEAKHFLPNYNNKKKYCITIPPPNITGTLHMGHAYQCILMDILIKYYKMNKYSTLWKMGTDHAGIATQILIEKKIKNDKNIDKYKFAMKWKKIANNKIKKQLKTLGCSLNWNTARFTLDNHFSYAVKTAFIKLYEEKLIYKNKTLVNWDTTLQTAISDLEVIYEEIENELFFIKYKIIENTNDYLVIATTRPETIFADVAIAINPEDTRYKNIRNKTVLIPIINKKIPIILDKKVDINFGSGCLKITPGHDFNDFELSKEHNLEILNLFTKDGKLNNLAPKNYVNLTILEARKKIKEDLIKFNLIEKIEKYKNKIPKADRSNSIIEPLITEQWYVKTKPLSEPVYNAIKNNKIKIIPIKWKKIFFNWLDNIKDWCISRQIWWGHRIPIWYDEKNNEYAGYSKKNIIKKFNIKDFNILKQDENVLDTWFSSALWPFASLGWPNKKIEFKNFYPTNTLVTGFDIIFFWAIKMMMFGLKFTNSMPFKEIYIHGLIRDKLGNKMSKTKGNVLDPLDLINGITKENLLKKQTSNLMNEKLIDQIKNNTEKDYPNGIESFGTDALRLTFCSISTENITLKLDIDKIKNYKNFCTKIWNASIFINLNKNKIKKLNNNTLIYNTYIISVWENNKKNIKNCIKFRHFSFLIENIYKFFWNIFCNWQIEITKIIIKNNQYKNQTLIINKMIFEEFLKILHPIAPYITEEIWSHLNKKNNIINEIYPKIKKNKINYNIEKNINKLQDLCSKIRNNKIKNELILILNETKNLIYLDMHKNIIKNLIKLKSFKIIINKEKYINNLTYIKITDYHFLY